MDYFKIDKSPAYQLTEEGKTILIDPAPVLQHPCNLRNYAVYDLQKKEILHPGAIDRYAYEFSARVRSAEFYGENGFIKLKDFLDYHHENSKDKPQFLAYLQYGILENFVLMDGHRCLILIREWIRNKKEELSPAEKTPIPAHKKVKWNGTQKNLAELILELEKRGWIDKIEVGERAKVCESIISIFDLTATQKKSGTNILKSFTEIMTPFYDNMTKETSYPKVFTERYNRAFEKIKTAKKTT